MSWKFTNDKPIFQQIVDIISTNIIRGEYQSGDKLEPVRELALTAGVNPNTMQKALSEIEQTGLIYTKRGDGRYISDDKKILLSVRKKYVIEKTENFISALKSLGLNDNEIMETLEEKINSEEKIVDGDNNGIHS